MRDSSLSYARKRLEKQYEAQELERKRRLRTQRLELARAGIVAYQKHKLAESAKHFLAYIKILEEIKEVSPGGLHPRYFDIKEESSELLMISGVYWDLVKLFDRTRSPEKFGDFRHYMSQYIAFSKDMPYQHLCAEALRKYLGSDKAVHRDDFKSAYKSISTDKCFIAGALIDYIAPETLPQLREFRDTRLNPSQVGKQLVTLYYHLGPDLACTIEFWPEKRKILAGRTLDHIAAGISRWFKSPGDQHQ